MGFIVRLSRYLIVTWCLCHAVNIASADQKWLLLPERNVETVIGSRISLFWRYKDPGTNEKSRITFSHHPLGYSYETLLVRAEVDPVSGTLSFDEAPYPDKIVLHAVPGFIRISFDAESVDDSGRYILDVEFGEELPIHDLVNVHVYEQPGWVSKPNRESLIRIEESVTFTWSISAGFREPSVQRVAIFRHNGNMSDVLTAIEHVEESDKWMKSYHKGTAHNMLFDVNHDGSVMKLILWDVTESNSGSYIIKVTFKSGIFELQDKIWIYVSKTSDWILTPPNHVYALESRDLRLVYIPNWSDGTNGPKTIILMKTPETKIVSLTDGQGAEEISTKATRRRHAVIDGGQIQAVYDHKNSKITFSIENINKNFSGSYEMRMYVSGRLLQRHAIDVTVLSDSDIEVLFKMEQTVLESDNERYEIDPGQLVVTVPFGLPLPDMELYSLEKGFTKLYVKGFNVSFLEVMITRAMLEEGNLTLGVYYEFAHKIYKLVMAPSASTLTASASLFGVAVLIICVLLLASLIWFVTNRYRHRHVNRSSSTKSNVDKNEPSDRTQSCLICPDEKNSSWTGGEESRNASHDRPSARSSPVGREKTIGADVDGRKDSKASTCSSRNSRTTFMVHAVYVRKDDAGKDVPSARRTRRRSTASSSSSAAAYNPIASRTIPSSLYPERGIPTAKRSASTANRARSQDFELGSDDVFYPEVHHPVHKHKSASDLDPEIETDKDTTRVPEYRIHRATGTQYYDTLPAFLVRYHFKGDN